MDRLSEMKDRLDELTGDWLYTQDELKELEQHFGRRIDFASPGWVVFAEGEGKDKYWRDFTRESEDVMLRVAEKRIEGVRQLAARIDACKTDEEVQTICADIMLDYARSWEGVETRSTEAEHMKRTMLDIRSIEVKQGRLVYEGSGPSYSCIVLDPYHGTVLVRRQDDGRYSVTQRVPLCGECSGTYDALHLKRCMVDFMRFIG